MFSPIANDWRLVGGVLGLGVFVFSCGGGGKSEGQAIGAFVPNQSWEKALSVSEVDGLNWKRDEGFLIAGHTVPTLLILEEGYRLFTSAPQRGQIAVHASPDAVNWTPQARLDLAAQPEACRGMALDLSVQYLPDGYRLVVENWERGSGLMDPSGSTAAQATSPTTFCAWRSSDGEHWEAESQALVWRDDEPTWPSGLEFFQSQGESAVYYVDTHPDLDGIRRSSVVGSRVEAGARETLLGRSMVDPNPVHLLEGGVRLFHTRALDGALAYADSTDGLAFGKSQGLKGLSGQTCFSPPERPSKPDACFLDPFFLRLVDGRMLIYFSVFESLEGGVERRGIGRAWSL